MVIIESTTEDIAAVSLLDEPVRRRLYEWVVAQGRPAGREEAAGALSIGRALATFHLDRLAAGGLLESGYKRLTEKRGPGAGRPARVYWRAQRDFNVSLPDRRYERMAELFATALDGPDSLRNAAVQMGERLAAGSPDLVTALETNGYDPVTEPDGTIRLRNCPFHALVAEHRDLVCGANLAMAEGITHAADARMLPVLDPQPGYCCVSFQPASEAG